MKKRVSMNIICFWKMKFDELNVELQQATSSEQIDDNIKHFESLMGNICDPLFSKKIFP